MFRFHKEIVDESLSDLEIIKGLQVCDKKIEESFYLSCRRYFIARRFGVLAAVHTGAREPQDLFQDSFLKLWQEIQARRIFVCDNYTWRIDKEGVGRRMSATLKTYLMAIAKYKNYENIREEEIYENNESFGVDIIDEEPEDDLIRWIVTRCVNQLPDRCKEILTLFYYENKSLDEILAIRKENQSKDGLKTGKSKCVKNLRDKISRDLEQHNIKMYSHV